MPAMQQSFMLDTNVFNDVLDGKISPLVLDGYQLFVTGIQADELRAAKAADRRELLLTVYEEIKPASMQASSFAFDIEGAGLGQAHWNDGSGNFEKMLVRLQVLDHKNKNHRNQVRDILIAETAIKNGAGLVTADANLRQVVSEFGGRAIDPASLR